MELPAYEEIVAKEELGNKALTSLEIFIRDWEPSEALEASEFRSQLSALIESILPEMTVTEKLLDTYKPHENETHS